MRVCAECAHAHAREIDILALATLALGAPTSLRSPSTDAHPGHRSLATLARSSLRSPSRFPPFPLPVNVPSSPPPTPALATLAWASCLLRAGGTPALRRQGLGKGCAIVHLPPQALHSLRSPSLSLASLARCRSVPPGCYRYGGRVQIICPHTPPLSQSGRTTL